MHDKSTEDEPRLGEPASEPVQDAPRLPERPAIVEFVDVPRHSDDVPTQVRAVAAPPRTGLTPFGVDPSASTFAWQDYEEPELVESWMFAAALLAMRLVAVGWAVWVVLGARTMQNEGVTLDRADDLMGRAMIGFVVAFLLAASGSIYTTLRTVNVHRLDGRLPSRARCITAWLFPLVALVLGTLLILYVPASQPADVRPLVAVLAFLLAMWRPYSLVRRLLASLTPATSNPLLGVAFVLDLAGLGVLWWQLLAWGAADEVTDGRVDVLVAIGSVNTLAIIVSVAAWFQILIALRRAQLYRRRALRTRHTHRMLRLQGIDPLDADVWWAMVHGRLGPTADGVDDRAAAPGADVWSPTVVAPERVEDRPSAPAPDDRIDDEYDEDEYVDDGYVVDEYVDDEYIDEEYIDDEDEYVAEDADDRYVDEAVAEDGAPVGLDDRTDEEYDDDEYVDEWLADDDVDDEYDEEDDDRAVGADDEGDHSYVVEDGEYDEDAVDDERGGSLVEELRAQLRPALEGDVDDDRLRVAARLSEVVDDVDLLDDDELDHEFATDDEGWWDDDGDDDEYDADWDDEAATDDDGEPIRPYAIPQHLVGLDVARLLIVAGYGAATIAVLWMLDQALRSHVNGEFGLRSDRIDATRFVTLLGFAFANAVTPLWVGLVGRHLRRARIDDIGVRRWFVASGLGVVASLALVALGRDAGELAVIGLIEVPAAVGALAAAMIIRLERSMRIRITPHLVWAITTPVVFVIIVSGRLAGPVEVGESLVRVMFFGALLALAWLVLLVIIVLSTRDFQEEMRRLSGTRNGRGSRRRRRAPAAGR